MPMVFCFYQISLTKLVFIQSILQLMNTPFITFYYHKRLIHFFVKRITIEDFKVAVGPKRSTNRNLKQIITTECTKAAIFQLLRPPRHLKIGRERAYTIIYHKMGHF